jgi:flotillin
LTRSKEIAIAKKQQEVELEEAARLRAVAQKEEAAQAVLTVEETAAAERNKQVDIIAQRALSEKQLLDRQLIADAGAYEIERQARAQAEAAELQAQAIERLAKANLQDAEARALGNFKLIEAKNLTRNEILIAEALSHAVTSLPEIVREAMKPAEKISDIRVLNVSGGGISSGNHGGAGKIVSAFLEAGAAFPLLREMLKFAGIDGDSASLSELLRKGMQSSPEIRAFIEANVPATIRQKLAGEVNFEAPTPGGSTPEGTPTSVEIGDDEQQRRATVLARKKAAQASRKPS